MSKYEADSGIGSMCEQFVHVGSAVARGAEQDGQSLGKVEYRRDRGEKSLTRGGAFTLLMAFLSLYILF